MVRLRQCLEEGQYSQLLPGARQKMYSGAGVAVGNGEWGGLGQQKRPCPWISPPGSHSLWPCRNKQAHCYQLFFPCQRLEIQLFWEN